MSYRHPRFYREDFTGFNRAMQQSFNTQFTNVMDYYDEKIAERKQYETDLYAQADKMREEAEAAGNIGADFQKKLEEDIQKFLKEGLEVKATGKRGGIGLFGSKIEETGKKSKLDLDKANANFKAEITAANGITDRAFIQDLEIDEDYDHGSGSYLEYASIIKGLKSNFREGGSIGFEYKGDNNFAMGITINNPRYDDELPVNDNKFLADGKTINPDYNPKQLTYTSQEIQRLIGENDPEARKRLEERIEKTEKELLGLAKSDLEKRFNFGNSVKGTPGNMAGKAYYGQTDVENRVEQYVQELGAADENNPDDVNIIDDIFNNKVKFTDATRLEELQKVEGSEKLLDKVKDPKLADELAMLLDVPKNDIHYQKSLLRKMGITDPKEVREVMGILDEAKNNMVKRYLVNTVTGAGIGSKSISPTQPKTETPKGGANTQIEGYSEKKFGEIGSFLGGSTPIPDEEGGFVGVGNFQEEYGTTYNKEMDKIFLNQKISTDVGDKDIKGVLYNPDTKEIAFSYIANKNMKLKVNKDGLQEFGDLGDETAIFDLSDPVAFEKLYLKIGTKADGESKDARAYEVKYKQLAQNYGLQNFYNHLFDDGSTGKVDVNNRQFAGKKVGGMEKWVSYTLANNKEDIYSHFKDGDKYQIGGRDAGAVMITNPVTGTRQTLKSYIDGINTFRGYTPNTQ